MPQHQRTGPLWTIRRLRRRAELERRLRSSKSTRPADGSGVVDDVRPCFDSASSDRPLTTVDATLRPGPGRFYRRIIQGPGEPHVLRDSRGVVAASERSSQRTSLLYFAHHTDVHLCDAQSPSRLELGEKLAWVAPGTDAGHRPQEHATVQVFDQMVRATNAVRISPVSGAEMAFCIETGDNTDNRLYAELRWFIDTLDGQVVTPNTGGPDYEGAQASNDFGWVYHPDDPSKDLYGRFGFPCVPGLLASAIRPFEAQGSAVPWLAVLGNHDVIWQGTFGNRGRLRLGDIGDGLGLASSKPTRLWSLLAGIAAESMGESAMAHRLDRLAAMRSVTVTADPIGRRPLSLVDQLAEFFVTTTDPGPVGHGFTEENLLNETAYWSRPHGSNFQLIGLDTNNHTSGSEGRVGPRQTDWLRGELRAATDAGRLIIVFSHHNSLTMFNSVDDSYDPGRATSGEELVSILLDHPNVVLWLNGHDHENRILHHQRSAGVSERSPGSDREGVGISAGRPGAFWEICTASCIDFGQQSRTIEIFDNADGTISVLSTVIDHAAPTSALVRGDGQYSPAEVAAWSREFASNDSRWIDPWEQRGDAQDRNVEMLLRDPRTTG